MGDQSDPGGGSGDQGKIKIGEKEYTPEDLQNALSQLSSHTEKINKVQPILDTIARYELEPEEFLDQALGSFRVINELMTAGIIDAQGNIIKPGDKKTDDKDGDFPWVDKDGPKGKPSPRATDVADKALESINATVSQAMEKLERLEKIQTGLIHSSYQDKILTKHPELTPEEADEVLARAMNEGKKSVWQYAEDKVKEKQTTIESLQRKFAEEHGLNYEELVQRKKQLNDPGQKGPGPGEPPLPKGKKISFRKGEDVVDPFEASQAYWTKLQEES